MSATPRRFDRPVLLVGGGPLGADLLAAARALAPATVAADQGADRLHALGQIPDLIVGDMDSIADLESWRARGVETLHLREQDSSDFEKCLYATDAPQYVAVGFTGGRTDHTLAVLHTLLRYPDRPVVVIGEHEAMALVPPGRALRLPLRAGSTVSVFPLAETTGTHSGGLVWPVTGLTMAPGRMIGTSNRAAAGEIEIGFDRPGALLMVEHGSAADLIAALRRARET